MVQAIARTLVMHRARVRCPVGTIFWAGVFPPPVRQLSGSFRPQGSRISFGCHNHPFILALLESMGAWMVCIVFHVRVSEVTPTLNWSHIRRDPSCPCAVNKICTLMWSRVNSLSRQVVALESPGGVSHLKAPIRGRLNNRIEWMNEWMNEWI